MQARNLFAVVILLVSSSALVHADSILNGVGVNLTWVTTGLSVYQTYVENTVGSGEEFVACAAPSYTCSGPGSPQGDVLGPYPNNAVSVDLSDTSNSFTIYGADNADNTHFGNFVGGYNGFEISIDETSALAQLGQYVYFTAAIVSTSSGNWTGGNTPTVYSASSTSIIVNFNGLPTGPDVGCSGFASNTPCNAGNLTGAVNDVVINYTEQEVPPATPEPGSMLLLGTGVLGLIRRLRRTR